MLYLLFVFCVVCFILSFHFAYSSDELDIVISTISDSETDLKDEDIKTYKRYSFLFKAFIIAFIVGVLVTLAGTVYVCSSDFLTTVEQSEKNIYQVTDFSAERSTYNLLGEFETKYTATVEENLKIEISSKDFGTEIICNSYNPKTVTVEKNHYYKWWFMCPYDTYTYTFS